MTKPLFSWRHAILESDLPATTRHVLLTLSCHMTDVGESCFPSTKTIARETGLSERSVITHIHAARDAGWIKVGLHGFGGQRWAHHEYTVCTPEGTEPHAKGTEPDDKKALKELQSNSTVNSTSNSIPVGGQQSVAKQMFDTGVPLLAQSGMAEGEARQLIGQLRKGLGDDRALSALLAAGDKTDPATYLRACCKPDKGRQREKLA